MEPTLAGAGWELESAVERQHANPSFVIPSEDERTHLRAGDRVKLLFLFATADAHGPFVQGERMWVCVEQATEVPYSGSLESAPVTSDVLQPGARIRFAPDHVAAIYVPRTDSRHPNTSTDAS
jgi:hypothetical protein